MEQRRAIKACGTIIAEGRYLADQASEMAKRTIPDAVKQQVEAIVDRFNREVICDSRRFYVARVRREIEGRQRTHYAQAAQYLSIVRDLYWQLGDEKAGVDLISGIRDEFRPGTRRLGRLHARRCSGRAGR